MRKDWDEETWELYLLEHEKEWRENAIDDKFADCDLDHPIEIEEV